MAQLSWSPRSKNDLLEIRTYISKDSVEYAERYVLKIAARVEKLLMFPESGELVIEGALRGLREIVFGNYRIFYRYKNEVVEIVTIIHGARLLENIDLSDI